MSEVHTWDVAAANNNSAPPDGAPENMNYSEVNDTIREAMAAIKRWKDDIGGALTTGGTANAITVTPNVTYASLFAGMRISFTAGLTNTAATTLNVGGLGAADLRGYDDVALEGGEIVAGRIYDVVYTGTRWNLVNPELALNFVPASGGTFTGDVTIQDALTLDGTQPILNFNESDAGADEKRWRWVVDGDAAELQTRTDADAAGETAIKLTRTGVGVTEIELNADLLDLNGPVNVDNTINYEGTSVFYIRSRFNGGEVQIGTETSGGTLYYPIVIDGADDQLRLNNSSGEMARFDASGNFGKGTTNPEASVHIREDVAGNNDALIIHNRNASGVASMVFISGSFDYSDGRYAQILSGGGGSNYLDFATGNGATPTVKLRVDASGNVGIGTTTINQMLVVGQDIGSRTSANALVVADTSGDASIFIGAGSSNYLRIFWDESAQETRFQHREGGTIYNSLTFDGANVGINETSPDNALHVTSASGDGVIAMTDATGTYTFKHAITSSGNYYLNDSVSGTLPFVVELGAASNTLRIDSNDRVGIGTSSPGSKLEVNGAIRGQADFNGNQSGTLVAATHFRGQASTINGAVTMPTDADSGDYGVLITFGSSQTINRGSLSNMYVNGVNVSSCTLAARGVATCIFQSGSTVHIKGDVS